MTGDAMQIFDRRLLRDRWRRIGAVQFQDYRLLALSADLLAERLNDVSRSFSQTLELGARSDHVRQQLATKTAAYYALSSAFPVGEAGMTFVGDEELLPFGAGTFDLILSNLALQWINDLPGCLRQVQHSLKSGGLFLAAMAGGRTLQELRAVLLQAETEIVGGISPRTAPMVDALTASQLLQRAGFALPVVDSELIEFSFTDFTALTRWLRTYGAANGVTLRPKACSRHALFARAAELYQRHFPAEGGGITASVEVIFLHGWKE
jgi:SAM-dependent methyltransferase